jgi:hypothetical protein
LVLIHGEPDVLSDFGPLLFFDKARAADVPWVKRFGGRMPYRGVIEINSKYFRL